MKILIYIKRRVGQGGPGRIDNFLFNQEYNKYLWKGRPLTLDEFHAEIDKALVFQNPFAKQSIEIIPDAAESVVSEKQTFSEPPAVPVAILATKNPRKKKLTPTA